MRPLLALVLLLAVLPSSAAAQTADLAPFVGSWERRDAYITVFEDGRAVFRWRTGACDINTDPCDTVLSGEVIFGGRVEMQFTQAETAPAAIVGQVFWTMRPTMFARGPIRLTLMADNLVMLEQARTTVIYLCRRPRDTNTCDR